MQIRCNMEEEMVVERVTEIYEHISRLESLHPCEDVNKLFTQLVLTCMPPCAVDLTKLGAAVQDMRADLIRLCGLAEGLLEAHYADLLGSFPNPLDHVHIFPYYNNYLKLSLLEYNILRRNPPYSSGSDPKKVAFVGSGPLPFTSIVLAKLHLPAATFHNYDIDPAANERALRLVAADADLSQRMVFHSVDVMAVGQELREYEVVFLAALVGMDWEEKRRVVTHLARHMAPGAVLMVRSAHGARAFLYPVVEAADLHGFEVLDVHHPTDEVINSVVLARKCQNPIHSVAATAAEQAAGLSTVPIMLPCKCSEIHAFNPFSNHNCMEELAIEEKPAY